MKIFFTLLLKFDRILLSAQDYIIEVEATVMDVMMIYLKEYKKAPIDSATVVDGKFRLQNKLLEVKPMIISVGRTLQHILLDENPIYITCTTVSRKAGDKVIPSVLLSVKGDADQHLLQRMNQVLQKEMLVMLALSLSGEEKDKATKETLNASFIQAKEESKQLYDSIVNHNKDSYVSALVIHEHLSKERSIEELEMLYLQLSDRVKNAAPGQKLQQALVSMRTTGIGQTASDFTLQTPDGKELTLSSLRGKAVLLDFWASWCGPCIREIPGVKRVYEKYHDKGFEILSVSLDNKKENWTQAIEKHQLPWLHVCSLKGWQCPVAKLYNVSGVPMMLLIDAEGKIVANQLRGEKMLDEAVGKICK